MFKNLLNLLNKDTVVEKTDVQATLASLFVRAARIDNDYSEIEKTQIEKLILKKFLVTSAKAREIRLAGEELESNILDTVQITREIKNEIPFENRKALAEDLWSIVLADEKRTDGENSFMRTCVKLIGVNDVDSANARNSVITRLKNK
jgi:uncharacterized tellurite resistance protein B-like protein